MAIKFHEEWELFCLKDKWGISISSVNCMTLTSCLFSHEIIQFLWAIPFHSSEFFKGKTEMYHLRRCPRHIVTFRTSVEGQEWFYPCAWCLNLKSNSQIPARFKELSEVPEAPL